MILSLLALANLVKSYKLFTYTNIPILLEIYYITNFNRKLQCEMSLIA